MAPHHQVVVSHSRGGGQTPPEEAVAAATQRGQVVLCLEWTVARLRNLWVSLLRMICLILQISFPGHYPQSSGRRKTKAKAAGSLANLGEGSKDRRPMFPALGEAGSDDLFQSAKPKPAKKTNPFPLLEDEDDLFTGQRGTKNESNPTVNRILSQKHKIYLR